MNHTCAGFLGDVGVCQDPEGFLLLVLLEVGEHGLVGLALQLGALELLEDLNVLGLLEDSRDADFHQDVDLARCLVLKGNSIACL